MVGLGVGNGHAAETYSYEDFLVPPLPAWTDKYAGSGKAFPGFFKLSALVKTLDITLLQAIELQNHFKDLTANDVIPQKAFETAIQLVRDNNFESKLVQKKLDAAPFIVAIDMDETLLQQYYSMWECNKKKYYDYLVKFRDGSTRGVSMAPGWQKLLETIRGAGGLVIIYSANTDEVVWDILKIVQINNQSLADYADGVMTNNYLVLQGKWEWLPGYAIKPSSPVSEPSKELKLLDRTLDRVIIIDDNPTRIIQNSRLRLPKKYQADLFYSSKAARKLYNTQLPAIAAEITESAQYAKANPVTFAIAYLPYTQLGKVAVEWLVDSKLYTEQQAIEFIRKNPEFVDKKF